jgi:hypothetical protein
MVNNLPIFSGKPNVGFANVTAANTARDGSGTSYLIFSAEATYGSFVERIVVRPGGTIAAGVLRIFYNDGLGLLAANMSLLYELVIPAYSALDTTIADELVIDVEDGQLPPGARLYATTSVAQSNGLKVTAIGGDYAVNDAE